jgi:putative ABC transport system permease protein
MARLPLLRLFSLAMRQLLRDARAGELRVLFFALLVAVAASTAIGYFGARLNGAMMLRATEFLGADLVLEGSSPARPEQIRSGTELGLDHARSWSFPASSPPTTASSCRASRRSTSSTHCAAN